MLRRNKKQLEFNDSFPPDSLEGLQQQLADVTIGIDTIHHKISQSFAAKVAGEKHDADHGIDVDTYTQQEQALEAYREELLERIKRIQSGVGATALHDSVS